MSNVPDDINQVTISGEVQFIFDKRQTQGGTSQQDFRIKTRRQGYERQIVVKTFSDLADSLSVNLSVGDRLLLSGRIDEQRWQDPETQEWTGRHDIVATTATKYLLVNDEPAGEDAEEPGDPFDD